MERTASGRAPACGCLFVPVEGGHDWNFCPGAVVGAHVIFAANGMMVYQQKRSEFAAGNRDNDLQQENERYTIRSSR